MAIKTTWLRLISRLERTRWGNALIGMSPLLALCLGIAGLIWLDGINVASANVQYEKADNEQKYRKFHNLGIGCLRNGKASEAVYWFGLVADESPRESNLAFKSLLTIAQIYKATGDRESWLEYTAKAIERKPLIVNTRHEVMRSNAHNAPLMVSDQGVAWFNAGAKYGAKAAIEAIKDGKTEITDKELAKMAALIRQREIACRTNN